MPVGAKVMYDFNSSSRFVYGEHGKMKHELKILPCYFEAVLTGEKNFEIRRNNDRGFQKGDKVTLKEYTPNIALGYTGREIDVKIMYVTNYEQKEDYVVFGFYVYA